MDEKAVVFRARVVLGAIASTVLCACDKTPPAAAAPKSSGRVVVIDVGEGGTVAKLDGEAVDYAAKLLLEHWIQDGDVLRAVLETPPDNSFGMVRHGGAAIVELKAPVKLYFQRMMGRHGPRGALSDADRLNGFEWKWTVYIASPTRESRLSERNMCPGEQLYHWSDWKSVEDDSECRALGPDQLYLEIAKRNGVWEGAYDTAKTLQHPEAAVAPTPKAPGPSPASATKPKTLNDEAAEYAATVIATRWTRCGESLLTEFDAPVDATGRNKHELIELRLPIRYYFPDVPDTHAFEKGQEKGLTDAARLNGIEWVGPLLVYAAIREYPLPDGPWSPWRQIEDSSGEALRREQLELHIVKKSGKWMQESPYDPHATLKPISCDALPKPSLAP